MHCRSKGPSGSPVGFQARFWIWLIWRQAGIRDLKETMSEISGLILNGTRGFSDSLGTQKSANPKKSEPKFLRFPENEKPLLN